MELFGYYIMNILWERPFKMFALKVFVFVTVFSFHYATAQFERDNPIRAVVRQTLVATARSCMLAVNATEADIEYLRTDPPYPEKSSCILKCLLEKINIVQKNKYSKEGFMTAVTPLVFRHPKKREHMKMVSENCDKEVNHQHTDPCMLGNEITMCIFKYAPELQFNKRVQ